MSFLARRLAGTEGAFFAQQSKNAVSRLREKIADAGTSKNCNVEAESGADILPEILRHSIPVQPAEESTSSLRIQSSAWASHLSGGNLNPNLPNEMNPLNELISVPRATFGPKRWSLPSGESTTLTSTANEARKDHASSPDPEKMKAAMDSFSEIGKAFAIATGIVFGGAILIGMVVTKKLELHTSDDVQQKGRNLLQPKAQALKEQFGPIKTWQQLAYLNHTITAKGIRPDLEKVHAILERPTPTTTTKEWEFLGEVGYNRRFHTKLMMQMAREWLLKY